MSMLSPSRVRQTTTTSGAISPYQLIAAETPFRNFADAYFSGVVVPYCATDGLNGYEIGVGTFTASVPDQISRDYIILSSNANATVAWSLGGTLEIFPWEIANSVYAKPFAATTTVTLSEWGNTFVFTGSSTTTWRLPLLATVPRGYAVGLKNSGTANVNATPQIGDVIESLAPSAPFPHRPGTSAVYSSDGTVWRQAVLAVSGGVPVGGTIGQILRKSGIVDYDDAWQDAPMPVSVFFPGMQPSSAIARVMMTEAGQFQANFAGSFAKARIASGSGVMFTVNVNATPIGTITFAISATTGTLATTGGLAQSFNAGDFLEFISPSVQDVNLADIAIGLRAIRA